MAEFLVIVIGAALANNFVLIQFLGVTGVLALPLSNTLRPALLVAGASSALIVSSAAMNHLTYHFILVPSDTAYLRLVTFMFTATVLLSVLAALWQRIHILTYVQIQRALTLVAINTCILGTTVLSIDQQASFGQSVSQAIGAALGFTIVLLLISAMRLRLSNTQIPKPFRGPAIALISTGLLALGFLGFAGIV